MTGRACSRSTSIQSSPGRCATAAAFRSTSIAPRARSLLRVPGFGTKAVDRILSARRHSAIRFADLSRLHIPRAKALPFIVLADHRPRALDDETLADRLRPPAQQLTLGL